MVGSPGPRMLQALTLVPLGLGFGLWMSGLWAHVHALIHSSQGVRFAVLLFTSVHFIEANSLSSLSSGQLLASPMFL